MKNCQFKALRENTLLGDNLKETHARQINVNPFGMPGQRIVKFEQMNKLSRLSQLVPIREIKKIVSSDEENEGDKKQAINVVKEELKEEAKNIFRVKANCDLIKTYNPQTPSQNIKTTEIAPAIGSSTN